MSGYCVWLPTTACRTCRTRSCASSIATSTTFAERSGSISAGQVEGVGIVRMRLLIVSQYFWPENFRINLVAEQLAARGHEVTALCGTPNYPAGRIYDGYGWFRRTREVWRGVQIVRV